MSKLQELIETLCPNGVEYFNVKELTKKKTIKTITPSIKIKRNDYQENGITPIISQELEYISGYCDFTDNSIPKNNYVCFGDHSEHIKFVDFAFVQGADGLKIMSLDEEKLMAKFFYYAISSFYVRHNNYERHFKYLNETEIPVPPLEVQREIVHILDSFTLLTAELTAELTARKKQYEYYRDALLKFDNDMQMVKLSELCKITRGIRVTRSELNGDSGYPVYQNSLTPMGYYNKPNRKANTSFIISAGAAGEIGYSTEDYWAADDCLTFECTSSLNDRFLYHFFKTKQEYLYSRVRKASIPRLSREVLEKLEIPLLPIEIQNRLVSVLDKFDAICSDLNIGLPAEIEARQKQYEFYRDKLLTFKQL